MHGIVASLIGRHLVDQTRVPSASYHALLQAVLRALYCYRKQDALLAQLTRNLLVGAPYTWHL